MGRNENLVRFTLPPLPWGVHRFRHYVPSVHHPLSARRSCPVTKLRTMCSTVEIWLQPHYTAMVQEVQEALDALSAYAAGETTVTWEEVAAELGL